jgi:hypothetical protein
MLEDLGGTRLEHTPVHQDENDPTWSDNEAHAPGKVCVPCGAVIMPGQDVRRRADGQWMHEICPVADLPHAQLADCGLSSGSRRVTSEGCGVLSGESCGVFSGK